MSFEVDREGLLISNDTSNPIIRGFVEEVLSLAQRNANLSSKYTARDIIVASKLILPSPLKRRKSGNVAPSAFALKEEKRNASPDTTSNGVATDYHSN